MREVAKARVVEKVNTSRISPSLTEAFMINKKVTNNLDKVQKIDWRGVATELETLSPDIGAMLLERETSSEERRQARKDRDRIAREEMERLIREQNNGTPTVDNEGD